MVTPRLRSQEHHPRASSGSEASPRKLTLSCSRCRASKLKCDRQEPCVECLKRNVGHLCTKDERQPRAKRAKVNPTSQDSPDNLRPNASEARDTVQLLEDLVDGSLLEPVPHAAGGHSESSPIADDPLNPYWCSASGPQRQDEKLALLREIVDQMPGPDLISALYDAFVTRCQGSLGNIIHTPTFLDQANGLYECLICPSAEQNALLMSERISMEMLSCLLMALVLGLAFYPGRTVLGWSKSPVALHAEAARESGRHIKIWRSLALRCLRGSVSLFCGSIPGLQAAIMILLDAHEDPATLDSILVTAISGAQKLGLHRLGDVKLKADTSMDNVSTPSLQQPYIRTEIGVRIWWALVMRDWSRGQALGYYSIHPSQFNTRPPLHVNDNDLWMPTGQVDAQDHITERPRSEFTMLSYTIQALGIVVLVRESIDLRGPVRQVREDMERTMHRELNRKYERFIAQLPSHFRLGNTAGLTATGPLAAIPVQRWMLHQQLWSLFLRIHRGNLSSQDGRISCQLLAQNIITIQVQIQSRCTVCSSLSAGDTLLFNAAAALVTDLIFSATSKENAGSGSQLAGLMSRDKVREAIELLRMRSGVDDVQLSVASDRERAKAAHRSMNILEALMKLENEMSEHDNESRSEAVQGEAPNNICNRSPRSRIIDVIRSFQDSTRAAVATEYPSIGSSASSNISTPFPAVIEGLDELDVLPVISNDFDCDIWQFLDFDSFTEHVTKPAGPANLPVPGSIPLSPYSGQDNSVTGMRTPGF
ncbi:hypothetical protein BO70DRAFT_346152 [Aspergillus heteromorphus CBS 117.55]|uniref:Zn(2)-C6 fungal-type domain-containing protein n=1 Tax=Aspergillus heteromorphus CBS 117.55 TaxID=1448321 RepID=A0A317UZR2_9EURO|nr:uncharacterized protein BO70DRAFT_346152 [Aspergillus heteromorphus CBS 117.55]PWY66012.1 hypothetical protein BO70DRAFT_346152 [Aspergillus heteromorphus CBS 117.55]